MDPLTHSLVGALSGKAVRASKRRVWIMAVLGMAPDVDVLSSFFAGAPWWLQHRGITHSLVGLTVQVVFYSALLSRWDRGSFLNRSFSYALPLGLHVLGDYLTGYGVPLLSPFLMTEYSGRLLVNLSLIPLAFMGAGFVLLSVRPAYERFAVRAMVAAWSVYLLFGFSAKAAANAALPIDSRQAALLPGVYNPFKWRAVEVDKSRHVYRVHRVDLTGREHREPTEIALPNGDYPIQRSLQSSLVKSVMEANEWPVVKVEGESDGWKVTWGALMFSVRGTVRKKAVVHVDKNGRLLSEESVFGFYTP